MTNKTSNETELIACIAQIKVLLLKRRFGQLLGPSDADRAQARVLVHTTLPGLRAQEKGDLVRFLHESDLIGVPGKGAVLDLGGADLSSAKLREADLRYADLVAVNLVASDLHGADLRWANLAGADLAEAGLGQANLRLANLVEAGLEGADLADADLGAADLSGANLDGANLQRANLAGFDSKKDAAAVLAEWVGEESTAREGGEHFRRLARLRRGAGSGARLVGASLRGANLAGAIVTGAQLAQAASVEGVVLPEGEG